MPDVPPVAAPFPARRLQILGIDDSPEELELIEAALQEQHPPVRVETATSWATAHSVLTASDAWRPDLILVDVHLPGADGFVILRRLKADPVLRFIPVIVRSGSTDARDVAQAYGLQASAFITKPSDFSTLVEQMRALLTFWRFSRTPFWHGTGT